MAKFLATVDSFGYQGRYWNKGEIVSVSKTDPIPPEYSFRPLKAGEKPEAGDVVTERGTLGC